tara:strand:- start:46136 stop:46525 length:390 start_codon:yes stop_codon:yes gene_type:complete
LNSNRLPLFDWFYAQGDVLVTVSLNTEGVEVPKDLRQEEFADFVLGESPTPKLIADDVGVSASMRFSGALYSCYFPWTSIVQMSGTDAAVQFRNPLLTDTPPDSKEMHKCHNRNQHSRKKSKPNLRLVK